MSVNKIYFLLNRANNVIKIGKTNRDVEARLQEIRRDFEAILTLHKVAISSLENLCILLEHPNLKEKDLHEIFGRDRIVGEWFKYSDDIQELISMIKKGHFKTNGAVKRKKYLEEKRLKKLNKDIKDFNKIIS